MQRRLKRTASNRNIQWMLTMAWLISGVFTLVIAWCFLISGQQKDDTPKLEADKDFVEWYAEWQQAYELDVGEPCGVQSDKMEHEPCEEQKD